MNCFTREEIFVWQTVVFTPSNREREVITADSCEIF